jgi:hypothetical protein
MISGKFHPSNVLWYSIENELKMIWCVFLLRLIRKDD